ncbi:MAG: hypothetical protein SGCHY_003770, partial [Lobulomycetales sp.]
MAAALGNHAGASVRQLDRNDSGFVAVVDPNLATTISESFAESTKLHENSQTFK